MNVVKSSLVFCKLFEAEVLLELMLRFWNHPLADDEEFRNNLIEGVTNVLTAAGAGEQLLSDVPASQMNFVAATVVCEMTTIETAAQDVDPGELQCRKEWLQVVRRSLPSCLTNQNRLPD